MVTEDYQHLLQRLRHELSLRAEVADEVVYELIDEIMSRWCDNHYLKIADKVQIRQNLFNAIRRLDILQPLVDDPSISEIMINGHKEIFVERYGAIEALPLAFESEEQLLNVIQRIVGKVNRVVNESQPICDARLLDGSRISIVLPPIAMNGPTLTIRKFPETPMDMNQLIELGTLERQVADFLEDLVRRRYNIFICGGTGSGKTTFLNVLSMAIPKMERVITIEDSAELQLKTLPNLITLETRNANVEGRGEVSMRTLIKASLRMRPDRIVVGEVRGGEARDMLQAMNTGHDGSLSTGHANSAKDMLSRLETMVLESAAIPLEAIRQQIASAIDILVFLSRQKDRSRQVMEIVELVAYTEKGYEMQTIYERVSREGDKTELVQLSDLRLKR